MEDLLTKPKQKVELPRRWRNAYMVLDLAGGTLRLGAPEFPSRLWIEVSNTLVHAEVTWPSHEIAETKAREFLDPRMWEIRGWNPPADFSLSSILAWDDAYPE